jgi:CRP-like cAMP-binding protein
VAVDLIDALLDTEVFEGFRREDLERVEVRTRVYQKGTFLWHVGDPVVALYLVSSGLVKVRHIECDCGEVVLMMLAASLLRRMARELYAIVG